MIIQAGNSVLVYNSINKTSVQRQSEIMTMAEFSGSAKNADSVDISKAGQDMLSSSQALDKAKESWLSRDAHSNPQLADQMAYDFAHATEQPLVNLTEFVNGTGPMRYTANNAPVTEESQKYFDKASSVVLQAKTNIYDTEKAKGTSSADIMDKLVEYMNSQSNEYKEITNWDSRAYA